MNYSRPETIAHIKRSYNSKNDAITIHLRIIRNPQDRQSIDRPIENLNETGGNGWNVS